MHKFVTHFIPENVAPAWAKHILMLDSGGKEADKIPLGGLAPPTGKPISRICVLADLHMTYQGQHPDRDAVVAKALEYVDNEDIAFTVICGDLVDSGSAKSHRDNYERVVGAAQKPVYAISGNHDTVWGYPTDEHMISYTGYPLYYAVAKTDTIPTKPVKMYATAPVKHGIINDELWINGVMQTAYKLVEFEGAFYFISDGNKIARSESFTLTDAVIGGLTYPDGTPIPAGKYSFDADGKMIYRNGIYNDQIYINNVLQTAYKLVALDGDFYFISDENKIARSTNITLTVSNIGGLTFSDGTAIPTGEHYFGADGKLTYRHGIYGDQIYINNVLQTAYKLVAYGGNIYFVGDGDKIVKDTTITLTDDQIGGLTYPDGTPIKAGDRYFDENGHMDLTPPVDTVTRVFANSDLPEGVILIFLGHYGKDHTLNGGWRGGEPFSAEELSWLNNLLAANVGKRVIIFMHPYIPGGAGDIDLTVTPPSKPPNLWTPSGGITTDTGADFLAILARYPGAVVFNGHSHYRFRTQAVESDAIIHHPDDDSYISVLVPSLTKLRKVINGQRVTLKSGDADYGGEGYIVDLYDNYIYLRGRDFVNEKWVGIGTYLIYK